MIALEKLSRKNTTKRWENVTRPGATYLKLTHNRLNYRRKAQSKKAEG
jgi:hypothetical protein